MCRALGLVARGDEALERSGSVSDSLLSGMATGRSKDTGGYEIWDLERRYEQENR